MAHNVIADEMVRKAAEQQQARLVPIRDLADSASRIVELREALAGAESAAKAAYAAARKAGWSVSELKSMGIEEDGVPTASTARKAATKRARPAAMADSPAPTYASSGEHGE